MSGFPWAAFFGNVFGGFALSVPMVFVLDVASRLLPALLLGVGLFRGYTTSSTSTVSARQLISDGQVSPLSSSPLGYS